MEHGFKETAIEGDDFVHKLMMIATTKMEEETVCLT